MKPHASPVLHAINYLLGDLDEQLPDHPASQGRPAVLPQPAQRPRHGRLLHRLGRDRSHRARCGRPSRTATSASQFADDTARRGASSACSAMPSWTRARSGRPWPIHRSPSWASCCGWSTSTGSPWTGWCPTSRSPSCKGMFAAAGWQVVTLKWGRLISDLFASARRRAAPERLEQMPNEEYQRMLRVDSVRRRRADLTDADGGPEADALRDLVTGMPAAELAAAVRDLGGHDLGLLVDTFTHRRQPTARPSCSPTRSRAAGCRPRATRTTTPPCSPATRCRSWRPTPVWTSQHPVAAVPAGQHAGRLCAASAGAALRREPVTPRTRWHVPTALGHAHRKPISTQATLGRLLADLPRDAPETAARVVTCSPDVASSTNLGGWINKTGVWSVARPSRLVRRRHRAGAALARGDQRPAHRARHRRGQPGLPARRARAPPGPGGASG